MKDGRLPLCESLDSPNCTTESCAKNVGAYSYPFYEKHRPDFANFSFLACSGADTQDCSSIQIPKIPQGTNLVTINIGGNNGGIFRKVVTRCIYLFGTVGCADALSDAQEEISTIGPKLTSLFNEIRMRAALGAKLIAFSYVRFWPSANVPKQCQSDSLRRPDSSRKATMNNLVNAMNKELSNAAKMSGFHFVDVNPLFEQHRLCDVESSYIQWKLRELPGGGFDDGDEGGIDDPYAKPYNLGVFHPTKEGQQRYLSALESILRGIESGDHSC